MTATTKADINSLVKDLWTTKAPEAAQDSSGDLKFESISDEELKATLDGLKGRKKATGNANAEVDAHIESIKALKAKGDFTVDVGDGEKLFGATNTPFSEDARKEFQSFISTLERDYNEQRNVSRSVLAQRPEVVLYLTSVLDKTSDTDEENLQAVQNRARTLLQKYFMATTRASSRSSIDRDNVIKAITSNNETDSIKAVIDLVSARKDNGGLEEFSDLKKGFYAELRTLFGPSAGLVAANALKSKIDSLFTKAPTEEIYENLKEAGLETQYNSLRAAIAEQITPAILDKVEKKANMLFNLDGIKDATERAQVKENKTRQVTDLIEAYKAVYTEPDENNMAARVADFVRAWDALCADLTKATAQYNATKVTYDKLKNIKIDVPDIVTISKEYIANNYTAKLAWLSNIVELGTTRTAKTITPKDVKAALTAAANTTVPGSEASIGGIKIGKAALDEFAANSDKKTLTNNVTIGAATTTKGADVIEAIRKGLQTEEDTNAKAANSAATEIESKLGAAIAGNSATAKLATLKAKTTLDAADKTAIDAALASYEAWDFVHDGSKATKDIADGIASSLKIAVGDLKSKEAKLKKAQTNLDSIVLTPILKNIRAMGTTVASRLFTAFLSRDGEGVETMMEDQLKQGITEQQESRKAYLTALTNTGSTVAGFNAALTKIANATAIDPYITAISTKLTDAIANAKALSALLKNNYSLKLNPTEENILNQSSVDLSESEKVALELNQKLTLIGYLTRIKENQSQYDASPNKAGADKLVTTLGIKIGDVAASKKGVATASSQLKKLSDAFAARKAAAEKAQTELTSISDSGSILGIESSKNLLLEKLGKIFSLFISTPILSSRRDEIRTRLDALNIDKDNPFAEVVTEAMRSAISPGKGKSATEAKES